MAKTILGVDIGHDQLKLALVRGKQVLKTASAPMPENLLRQGQVTSREAMAELVEGRENSGKPKLCFVVGGSYGLAESVKKRADLRLSMSKMTFPHHLARIMLAEQLYRGYKIREGSRYHK